MIRWIWVSAGALLASIVMNIVLRKRESTTRGLTNGTTGLLTYVVLVFGLVVALTFLSWRMTEDVNGLTRVLLFVPPFLTASWGIYYFAKYRGGVSRPRGGRYDDN